MLPTHERTMIVIPAHGMSDVRDALTDILAEFGKEETSKSLACLHFIIVSQSYAIIIYSVTVEKHCLQLVHDVDHTNDDDDDDAFFVAS